MKILAIHRFYWPDTPPYASFLREIVKRWVSDGHSVDVLSSYPSYKVNIDRQVQADHDLLDGANVVRLNLPNEVGRPGLRVFNALRLGLHIVWQGLFRSRYDVIMISTYPPVVGGIFAALTAKLTGARFIYHCMDVHPEIGRHSGEFKNRYVFSLLSYLDRWTCRQANPVVVLSDDMKDTLVGRESVNKLRCEVVNNFSLPSDDPALEVLPFDWPLEEFVLLFAGNLGRFQGLDDLILAMEKVRQRTNIRLLVMGDGSEKKRLQKVAEESGARITFIGHQSVAVAKCAIQRAQVGFISLAPQLYRYAYPSKTMTYLEFGCPILVVVEQDSRMAQDIVSSGAGISVQPGSPEAIATAIVCLADNRDKLSVMSESASKLGLTQFSKNYLLKRWSELLKEDK